MIPYLDQILGIYAPDVPGVRAALTAIVEGEIATRVTPEQRSTIQIAMTLAGAGSPHDGNVDGVRWLAARAERAEADAATLRALIEEWAEEGFVVIDDSERTRLGLTSGGQR